MKRLIWIANEQLNTFLRHNKLVHFISGSIAILVGMILYLLPSTKIVTKPITVVPPIIEATAT